MPVRWYLGAKAVVDFYGCEGYESLYNIIHIIAGWNQDVGCWLFS